MIGAQEAHEIAFFLAAGGGEDLCPEVFGELDGGNAHPAGTAVDEHALARLQVGQMLEGVIHREKHGGHGGGGFERPFLRHPGNRRGRGDDVAGEAGRAKAHDFVSGPEIPHARPDAADDAGEFQPQAGPGEAFFHRFVRQ